MTSKEKAEELIIKFAKLPEEGSLMWYLSFEIAKKCALLLVDEILKVTSESYDIDHINWWQEVKQEIEKL
jgi:hypothetical protein